MDLLLLLLMYNKKATIGSAVFPMACLQQVPCALWHVHVTTEGPSTTLRSHLYRSNDRLKMTPPVSCSGMALPWHDALAVLCTGLPSGQAPLVL
jgi:hypothetical protein